MPKIISSIEKIAETIGFDIANSDNITQARLFNGFARGWYLSMDEEHQDMQMCYITTELSKEARQFILRLADYVNE